VTSDGLAQQQPPPRKPAPALPLPPPSSTTQPNQSNQGEGAKTQQNRDADQRGTQGKPVIVKVLPAEKTAAERAQEVKDREDKAGADWWMVRLTAVLAIVGIGQGIVFAIQAIQLRNSVNLIATTKKFGTGSIGPKRSSPSFARSRG
jgi:hypothetical protein